VSNPALRSHQFLISLARTNMAPTAEVPLLTFEATQRETGEVLVEGEGAMELTATERGVLRRMDLKEVNPYLRSMARGTLHTAFRYQKKPAETPEVALEWVRFPNSRMLSAVAQQAVVTTLVTSEGRSLTEVKLTLKNQAQPFLKVDLPAGASILTADVAGEKVKPVQGADGSRVPLLRAGFRPVDAYTVSFVFVHAGAPFAKKGGAELTLPKMDVPIARIEWEVFLPQQYRVADFGGDAVAARLLPLSYLNQESAPLQFPQEFPMIGYPMSVLPARLSPGEVGGSVLDPTGAVIPGAEVVVEHLGGGAKWNAVTNQAGRWMVSNVPSGHLRVTAKMQGFQVYVRMIEHSVTAGTEVPITLNVGASSEAVTVMAEASLLQTQGFDVSRNVPTKPLAELPPSTNVKDLQRRVVGVLPIAVNVPRTGNSYKFIRPLAVDEETTVTFRYRTR